MYTHVQIAGAANRAAIDFYRLTANTLLDSTGRLVDLYSATRGQMIGLARREGAVPGVALFEEIAPSLFMGHLRLANLAYEDFVRMVETQIHGTSGFARFALDKTAQMSPPLVEIVIDSTESIISAGEAAADDLGAASLKAVGHLGKSAPSLPRAKAGGSRTKAPTPVR
jgi:hypothetical protein